MGWHGLWVGNGLEWVGYGLAWVGNGLAWVVNGLGMGCYGRGMGRGWVGSHGLRYRENRTSAKIALACKPGACSVGLACHVSIIATLALERIVALDRIVLALALERIVLAHAAFTLPGNVICLQEWRGGS